MKRYDRWVLFLVLVVLAAICLTTTCPAQMRRWPDRIQLVALADSAGIDRAATLAIAWEESAANLNPQLRGHYCWYTAHVAVGDLIVTVYHHENDCDTGRFQIRPSTARRRCPGLNIFTYAGNTRCFARMFAEDAKARGRLYAIRHHNGAGTRAEAYLKRVLQTIGWITETETS